METKIYSSNNKAVLRDNGPYKLSSADNSIKGRSIYSYQTCTSVTIVGNQTISSKGVVKTKIDVLKCS
jgi:hypothetical protein